MSPSDSQNSADPWLVPEMHRPSCPLSGEPCRSWTCLVDVCVDPVVDKYRQVARKVESDMLREVLEALCQRDGLSLESEVEPGKPAANYELALRLRIGRAFGMLEDS